MSQGTKPRRDLAKPLGAAEVSTGAGALMEPDSNNRAHRKPKPSRLVFLRLFEDVIDQLNAAVARRAAEGASKTEIAERGDIAPALLSRVLKGRSGTNLRTVAAVLAGTDHRFQIVSVPCDRLPTVNVIYNGEPTSDGTHHYVLAEGVWQEPLAKLPVPKEVQVYSTDTREIAVDA